MTRDALRRLLGQLQKAAPHPAVKGEALLLEARPLFLFPPQVGRFRRQTEAELPHGLLARLGAPGHARPCEAVLRGQVEKQREIGRETARGGGVNPAHDVDVDAPRVALVRHRRVGEAVGDDHGAAFEAGPDRRGHQLGPRRGEQQQLRLAGETDAAHPAPYLLPQPRPARLTEGDDLAPRVTQPLGKPPHLGRLADALAPFKRHEEPHSASHRTRAIPTTAKERASCPVAY